MLPQITVYVSYLLRKIVLMMLKSTLQITIAPIFPIFILKTWTLRGCFHDLMQSPVVCSLNNNTLVETLMGNGPNCPVAMRESCCNNLLFFVDAVISHAVVGFSAVFSALLVLQGLVVSVMQCHFKRSSFDQKWLQCMYPGEKDKTIKII